MCFRRATTIAAVAAVLLTSAPAATARAAGSAPVGYRACSLVRTIAWHSWVAGADGLYRPVTIHRPYALTVVFPVAAH